MTAVALGVSRRRAAACMQGFASAAAAMFQLMVNTTLEVVSDVSEVRKIFIFSLLADALAFRFVICIMSLHESIPILRHMKADGVHRVLFKRSKSSYCPVTCCCLMACL